MSDDQPKKSNFLTLAMVLVVMYVMFQPNIRNALGNAVGFVLEPIIGFDGKYPVLTLMIAATIMALLTSIVRHFTTDWLAMARAQSMMRHFQGEFSKARKDNNTYKIKKLQDAQPKMMAEQQKVQMASMKTMPFTLILVVPLFAWMFNFVDALDYVAFSAPWNPMVMMFDTNGIIPFLGSILPHWILLYSALTIPLGQLVQKTMKYVSWKERWQPKHPEVHE